MSEPAIPFIDLGAQQRRLRPALDRAIARVLDHGRYVMGPEVFELERQLAEFGGVREVVSCASGTDAIWLPLLAAGIGPGDAVLIPSFTFAATAEAVALTGATPAFVDVDPHDFNLDPAGIEAAVRQAKARGLQPRAIMPVDLFGVPAAYAQLQPLAEAHGLTVIADAAQSFGASTHAGRVGRFGWITGTSFFPAKPLGACGDGGAMFTDDPDAAAILRSLRVHGQADDDKYANARVGTNARLDTIQAAVLLEKLAVFPDELDRRDAVARRYDSGLADVVQTPRVPDGTRASWAQYTIQHPRRDSLADALAARGIPTAVYYPRPLHTQPPYRDAVVPETGLPVTEALAKHVLSLPMHPYLDPATQDRIVQAVRSSVEQLGLE